MHFQRSTFFLLCFLFLSGSLFAQLHFSQFAEMPAGASGMAYCSDGEAIYAFNGANPPLSTAWKYDPKEDEWTVLSEKLSKKWGANAVHLPGTDEILIFNGRMYRDEEAGISGSEINAKIESFNTKTGKIRTLGENPYPRYDAGATWYNGKILVFGGANSVFLQKEESFSGEVFSMDPYTLTFEKLTDLPEPAQTQDAVLDDVLYVVGGYQKGIALAGIYAYDLKKGIWSKAGEAPHGLAGHTVAAANGSLWILGGMEDLFHVGEFKTCSYDYQTIHANVEGRKYAATAMVGEMLFTFGGNQHNPCHDLLSSVQGVQLPGGSQSPNSLEGPGFGAVFPAKQ